VAEADTEAGARREVGAARVVNASGTSRSSHGGEGDGDGASGGSSGEQADIGEGRADGGAGSGWGRRGSVETVKDRVFKSALKGRREVQKQQFRKLENDVSRLRGELAARGAEKRAECGRTQALADAYKEPSSHLQPSPRKLMAGDIERSLLRCQQRADAAAAAAAAEEAERRQQDETAAAAAAAS